MTGKFLLRKDRKPNEWGEYGVILQYSTQGTAVKCSTGIYVHPDHWLGDNGRCDKLIKGGSNGNPKADKLNRSLLKLKREKDDIIDSLMLNNKKYVMTVPMLRSILNGNYESEIEKSNGRVSFVDKVVEYNTELFNLEKISYSVLYNIECNMKNFRKFLQEIRCRDTKPTNVLFCCEVDVQLIKDYIMWRQRRGNSNDTINKTLTPIFKTLKWCSRNGWLDRNIVDEICELYLPSQSKSLDEAEDRTLHYLKEEQIKELMKVVSESRYPRTKELWDLFMFSTYAFGMRFSDICTLRWNEVNLETRRIHHLQVKGHTRKAKWLDIVLCDAAVEILERWKGKYDNFVFGQLADEFDLSDEKALKLSIGAKNRTINTSLKEIGKKIGLPYSLHFHVARHTFGSLGLNRGVDVKILSTMMGHSSVTTTEKVYAKFFPETLKKEADERLNFKFG